MRSLRLAGPRAKHHRPRRRVTEERDRSPVHRLTVELRCEPGTVAGRGDRRARHDVPVRQVARPHQRGGHREERDARRGMEVARRRRESPVTALRDQREHLERRRRRLPTESGRPCARDRGSTLRSQSSCDGGGMAGRSRRSTKRTSLRPASGCADGRATHGRRCESTRDPQVLQAAQRQRVDAHVDEPASGSKPSSSVIGGSSGRGRHVPFANPPDASRAAPGAAWRETALGRPSGPFERRAARARSATGGARSERSAGACGRRGGSGPG
jgi:hypothetical protein